MSFALSLFRDRMKLERKVVSNAKVQSSNASSSPEVPHGSALPYEHCASYPAP